MNFAAGGFLATGFGSSGLAGSALATVLFLVVLGSGRPRSPALGVNAFVLLMRVWCPANSDSRFSHEQILPLTSDYRTNVRFCG